MNFQELRELHNLALKEVQAYPQKRFIYDEVRKRTGKHFIGIIGPRGVGKSVLLKQLAGERDDALYVSLDSMKEINLFEAVKELRETYGIKQVLLDEIHFCEAYERELKMIFDFLDVQVIFTSSASLSLHEARYDLARRVSLLHMYPFSFREYLLFQGEAELPRLTIADIVARKWQAEHFRLSTHFDAYLRGGLFPFALEEPDVLDLLRNVIQKILFRDIPAIDNLRIAEIQIIEKLISFVGKSAIDGINHSSIARNLGITKYKAERYIQLLAKAFILNVVFPAGTNVLREPKIVMNLPYRLLCRDWADAVGGIREDFFVETILARGYELQYLKSTRGKKTPDYLVSTGDGELVIEIGGKGKGREQFKGIDKEKSLIFTHSHVVENIKRPLFLLGYL